MQEKFGIGVASAMKNRKLTKATQVLGGICSGLVADAELSDKELSYLRTWLTDNKEATAIWPGDAIASRIDAIVADGVVTAEERSDLLRLLQGLAGNDFGETGSASTEIAAIPFDDVPIEFMHMTFCFTGQFFYGTRAACERVVLKLGAMAVDGVSKKLDFLVVGSGISEHWANMSYGRKIEAAMKLRGAGDRPIIVSEPRWTEALRRTVS